MSTPGQHVAASKVRAEGLTEISKGADLADILSRLRPGIESVLAPLFEAEDLWAKARHTENPQEKASTRRQAEDKQQEWKNAMREVMAHLESLDICLLKFGPKVEDLRLQIEGLDFRVLRLGRREFLPDSTKVAEGLRRLEQLLEVVSVRTGEGRPSEVAVKKGSSRKKVSNRLRAQRRESSYSPADDTRYERIGLNNFETLANPALIAQFRPIENKERLRQLKPKITIPAYRASLNRIRRHHNFPSSESLKKK